MVSASVHDDPPLLAHVTDRLRRDAARKLAETARSDGMRLIGEPVALKPAPMWADHQDGHLVPGRDAFDSRPPTAYVHDFLAHAVLDSAEPIVTGDVTGG